MHNKSAFDSQQPTLHHKLQNNYDIEIQIANKIPNNHGFGSLII